MNLLLGRWIEDSRSYSLYIALGEGVSFLFILTGLALCASDDVMSPLVSIIHIVLY